MPYPFVYSRLCVLLATTCIVGCTVPNPNYHPVGVCLSSSECAAPKGVCELESGECVQCSPTDSGACGGTTPICGPDNSCRGCSLHGECASNVCRPNGSCSDGYDVAYVAHGGNGTGCTATAPCGSLTTALGIGKPFIKLEGTIVENVTIDSKNVTILGSPGARLAASAPGSIVKVVGSAHVSFVDVTITGAKRKQSPSEVGAGIFMQPGTTATLFLDRVVLVDNDEGVHAEAGTVNVFHSTLSGNDAGVFASGGGVLNLSQSTFSHNGLGVYASSYTGSVNINRSTISQNIAGVQLTGGSSTISRSAISHNTLVGLAIMPGSIRFHIVNNFIIGNGGTGGILVHSAGSNSAIEFNTIVDNRSDGPFGAIACTGTVEAPNNLIFRNTLGDGSAQVSSDCSVGNSLLVAPENPGFAGPADYHLTADSPSSILNVVNCSGIEDFDGDRRPQGGKCDLGADEYRPTDM